MKNYVSNRIYSMIAVSGMFLLLISACKKSSNNPTPVNPLMTATVHLDGATEVPPVVTTGTGTANITYNKDTKMITYTITWTLGDPTSTTTAMHFHGSDAGSDATSSPVEIPITGFSTGNSGTVSGTTPELTATQVSELLANKWYVNIHSNVAPGGEMRGNIKLTSSSSTGGAGGGGGTGGY
jgi:hypothetical protein